MVNVSSICLLPEQYEGILPSCSRFSSMLHIKKLASKGRTGEPIATPSVCSCSWPLNRNKAAKKDKLFLFDCQLQTDGVALGFPLGPLLANVFMCSIDETLEHEGKMPTCSRRYIDNTLTIKLKKREERKRNVKDKTDV